MEIINNRITMRKRILNLTQHLATPEQVMQGVIDAPEEERKAIMELLTFDTLPTEQVILDRAKRLAQIAVDLGFSYAMIGGAPYLMRALENALCLRGIAPMYAFSVRVSKEVQGENGQVVKTNVFQHVGFVEV